MVAHKFAELIEALQAEKNRRKTEKSAGKPKHVPPPPNNGLGNNPLDAINATVLKRGRFTRPPAPNNGLGNNPLDAINATVLKRGRFTRPPVPNNGLGNNPLDAIQVNQNMRVAQNAAAAAAQKIAAHYLNYSNMLGNAARNSSKQAANMRAKTRNNRRSRRSRRTRR
jgi:hypothetical protein